MASLSNATLIVQQSGKFRLAQIDALDGMAKVQILVQ